MANFQNTYVVEVLDNTLTPITRIREFVPLDKSGNWIEFDNRLSDVGQCKFRVGTKDPLFLAVGDIFQPYTNHVRVTRAGMVVWQGVIVDNPHRRRQFVEIKAYTYLHMLDRVLVKHDTDNPDYRTFQTQTMAQTIQTILTEAITDNSANPLVKKLTLGTINNPNFPPGSVNLTNTSVAGQAWDFSVSGQSIKFDYRSLLYVITALAQYSVFDFEVNNALQFNFKSFLGNRLPEIMFSFPNAPAKLLGEIEDYDIQLNGESLVNNLWGVAADVSGSFLRNLQTDTDSITRFGRLDGVAAFADAKSQTTLNQRLIETLNHRRVPDAEVHFVTNSRAAILGTYGVGDLVTVRIIDHFINFNQQRRIVMIDVKVGSTGKETIRVVTNIPRANQS